MTRVHVFMATRVIRKTVHEQDQDHKQLHSVEVPQEPSVNTPAHGANLSLIQQLSVPINDDSKRYAVRIFSTYYSCKI